MTFTLHLATILSGMMAFVSASQSVVVDVTKILVNFPLPSLTIISDLVPLVGSAQETDLTMPVNIVGMMSACVVAGNVALTV